MSIHTLLLSAVFIAGACVVAQQPQPATPDAPQEAKAAQKPGEKALAPAAVLTLSLKAPS